MTGFNSGHWEGDVSGLESNQDVLNIKVSYGLNEHVLSVPSEDTFGKLKSVLAEKLGLDPKRHKILFRGKEKADEDDLMTAGMKNGARVILMENSSCTNESVEPVVETRPFSKGDEAVALVREEVDNLSMQVSALQCVVESNTKVDEKDIVYVTEMLMRQLLKLDGIEAEGEGKAKRKLQVHRVQGLVDTMDSLRLKNSNPVTNATQNGIIPINTQWETFDSPSDDTNSAYPAPGLSYIPASAPVEPVARYNDSASPVPALASSTSPVPLEPVAGYTSSASPIPEHAPSPISLPHYTPAFPAQYFPPNSYPVEFFPTASPSIPAPTLQPSPKITQDWEHFE